MGSPPWLLVLLACALQRVEGQEHYYRFATLFNTSKSMSASATGGLVGLGASQAGAVASYSTPAVVIGQPDDPGAGGSGDLFQLAEWSNLALAGREFICWSPRADTPHVIAIFAVEAATVNLYRLGFVMDTRVMAAGSVEHVTGSFMVQEITVISTGDVLVAMTSGGSDFHPIPPVAKEVFGQCSSACYFSIFGGYPGLQLTQTCTDGTVEQVPVVQVPAVLNYEHRTCRWAAPTGYKITGRAWADGGGSEATAFIASQHFQLVTPLPARMNFLVLMSDVPALCAYAGMNLTLTGAPGIYHARLTDVAAGTVFVCDAPVTAVGDAYCPDHFDRACSLKEMNIIAAPVLGTSTTTVSSTATTETETTITSWTTTGTATSVTSVSLTSTATASTATATSTSTATVTLTPTTATHTSTVTTSETATSLAPTATTSVTSVHLEFTATSGTATSLTSTASTAMTSGTTTSLTSTATTSVTTVSLTTTATTSATTVSLTSTVARTTTTVTSTSTAASATTVTHTSAVTTSLTTVSLASTATQTATKGTRTMSTATTSTYTKTTTPYLLPCVRCAKPTKTKTHTTTTTTDTTATTHTATGTTTTSTTSSLATATALVHLVESLEATLFSDYSPLNDKTMVKEVDGFILIAKRIDAAAFAAAGGGNLTVRAEGTEAAATVSTSILDSLEATDGGLVLVLTAFDPVTANSMSTDVDSNAPTQVRGAVNANLFSYNGSRRSVANLSDPVRVIFPLNYSGGVQCAFWDEASERWASEGVVLRSVEGRVVCETSHLTLFAAVGIGFVNTLACSQVTLLSAASLQELAAGDWYQTLGARMLGGFVSVFLLLLAMAAWLDWRRWRQGRHSDELFLIPISSTNVLLEDTETASEGFCHWLYRRCYASGALRDALDDVISNWATHFSEIRDFLEGSFKELELGPAGFRRRCRCFRRRCGCGCGNAHITFIHHVMSTTLAVSARRQAAIAVGISRDSSCLLMENEDICDVLLAHNARSSGACSGLQRSQSNVSAKVLKCEESWGKLHGEVEAKLEIFMETSARWSSLPCTIRRLFWGQSPFGASLVHCAFTSSKIRVLLVMVDLTGALMLATVFFAASGVPGKRNRSRSIDCTFEDPSQIVGRIIAIGTGSIVIAGIPSMILGSLCTRGVRKLDYEGCPAWRRQLLVWRIQDVAIWVLGLLYIGFCTFFMALFLANVAQQDQGGWLLSGLVSVVEDTIVIPFAVALALPLLCAASLSFLSRHEGVKKEDLISERHVQIKRQSNLTLPVERV